MILDWLKSPKSGLIEETNDLKSAVLVALCTDALADPSDELPDPNDTDRRGWWGDLDAKLVWNGWPLGSKLWLMTRAKIVDSGAREGATVIRIQQYTISAMQPFVDAKLCTSYTVDVQRATPSGITNYSGSPADAAAQRIFVTVTMYRGPKTAIQLEFQAVWDDIISGTAQPMTRIDGAISYLPPPIPPTPPTGAFYSGFYLGF